MISPGRPATSESNAYFRRYIERVPEEDAIRFLEQCTPITKQMLDGIPEARWSHRYAEGKWTIKEVVLHLIDTERIFAYRALRFARNDSTPLPGFEQDDYVPFTGAVDRNARSLIAEWAAVRNATLELFRNMDDTMGLRSGVASGSALTPRAIAFIIAGHEVHHMEVLQERYLLAQ